MPTHLCEQVKSRGLCLMCLAPLFLRFLRSLDAYGASLVYTHAIAARVRQGPQRPFASAPVFFPRELKTHADPVCFQRSELLTVVRQRHFLPVSPPFVTPIFFWRKPGFTLSQHARRTNVFAPKKADHIAPASQRVKKIHQTVNRTKAIV